ncbi:MAG: amidohydrolase family protein [Deltaproteobacteria bacterium]|nr:amidohydrolase family protein [Deltaproteobacteria bacterium]
MSLGIIDADTHIAESESMWQHLGKEWYHRRPVIVSVPDDTLYREQTAVWLIDGNIFPKPAGMGGSLLITPSAAKRQVMRKDITVGSRELTDPKGRIKDMDRLSIDTQVVYPTLFLVQLTGDVGLEVALCRAYNRFMAEACSNGHNRLRWIAIPPLRSVEESISEMRWAKENGAVGLFFRGMENDLNIDQPYFFPIYEEAAKLDLAICIHQAMGSPTIAQLFDIQQHSTFPQSRLLPLIAFRNIVANKIPERFPGLRFGFIEACAGWIPFLLHHLRRSLRQRWKFSSSVDLFREYRLFVACEADEDIPYLLQFTGEDHLVIGSDYGHPDASEEPELVAVMRARKDVSNEVNEKILSDNAQALYGLGRS